VGAYYSPTFVRAHPGLTLASNLFRAEGNELRVCDAEIAAESDDPHVTQFASLVDFATVDAKVCNLLMTVQLLLRPEAQGMLTAPEELG
jgi:hypothetical protein